MSVFKSFVPSVFTDLQTEVVTLNNKKTFIRHRDIHFVLADKVFNDIDPTQVKQFLNPLNSAPESLDAKFSDDELATFCKSRYIQEASDVQAYADSLKNFTSQLSTYAKNLKRSKQDVSSSVSTAKNSDTSKAQTAEN